MRPSNPRTVGPSEPATERMDRVLAALKDGPLTRSDLRQATKPMSQDDFDWACKRLLRAGRIVAERDDAGQRMFHKTGVDRRASVKTSDRVS